MCDKHVVKMILESAQMLSTAHRVLDESNDAELYKTAHKNHPCSIWVRKSSENYSWLYSHFKALSEEYTYRYGKIHSSWQKLGKILNKMPKNITMNERSPFAIAMKQYPECIVENDPIQSYRNYYRVAKKDFAKWTKREEPEWWK